MNPTPPQTDAKGAPAGARRAAGGRGRLSRGLAILGVAFAILLVLLAVLYLNRRIAAQAFLTHWLEERGAPSEVEIERLELGGVTARLRIGDPRDPDVVVERVEMDYAVGLPWSREGLGLQPRQVRLLRPVVRARWADGKLSLGSLDPILKEFGGRPSRPDARGPVVVIEDGRIVLAGAGEALIVRGDARLNDGKLMRLRAEASPARLNLPRPDGGRLTTEGLTARLDLDTVGDRVALGLEARADAVALTAPSGETGGRGMTVSLRGDLPYPDLKTRRGDGRVRLDGHMTGETLRFGGASLNAAALEMDFSGAVSGWIETFAIEGLGRAALTAGRIAAPDLAAQAVRSEIGLSPVSLRRDEAGVRWRIEGPVRAGAATARFGDLNLVRAELSATRLEAGGHDAAFEAVGPVALKAEQGRFGDLSLRGVEGRGDLDLTRDGALLVRLEAALRASGGAWPLMGMLTADDGPDLTEMKRALSDFTVDLPRLRLLVGSAGTEAVLGAPASLAPRNGGRLTVRPVARALYAARPGALGGGALELVAERGRGLPEARISIPEWRLTSEGFEAKLDGRAALDFETARGLTVTGGGLLASRTGVTTFAPNGCPVFAVERLELGENDAETVSGRLCAAARPLVELGREGWRADGRVEGVSGVVPFLEARFAQVAGPLAVRGGPDRMDLEIGVASARLDDTAEPRRFHPLGAEGRARLANEIWTGDFTLKAGERTVAAVNLRHDGPSQRGGLVFDTGEVLFEPRGLQPHDLTPLTVGTVKSPVAGSVRFAGRFDWDPALPEGGSSSGRLIVPGLDFDSPAGPVKGLSGTVDFTSLAPLTTAEGQTLKVAALETVTPLTDLGLTFTLGQAALKVEGGRIQAAGGALRLEPLSVPLDGKQPFDGVIALDGVQLGELIASAGFDDKVGLDAVVSGRLPFHWDPATGVTIVGGVLTADQPGRLSIKREALSGLAAGGGGAEIPPGTVEDLAYQAMENLAFSDLNADVNSLEGGRVGVLFHIRGRHDPPQRQELRLSLAELISRRFLERKLPLPSDTGIDLTLDTSLNLNQLIQDLLAAQRAPDAETTP